MIEILFFILTVPQIDKCFTLQLHRLHSIPLLHLKFQKPCKYHLLHRYLAKDLMWSMLLFLMMRVS